MRIFTNPWFVRIVGWLALSLLIWFAGPYIAFAEVYPLESLLARVVAIMAVAIVGLTVILIRQSQSRKTSDAIVDQIVVDDVGESGDQSEELRARFEDALTTLKKSKGRKGSGRINLYELPWYLIIGPPGSGKTTLIQNSGLYFPLADRHGDQPIGGVGGTRNCDWWFTDRAVILDTAGRYVTQDSNAQADRVEWFGFLDLLKKHRRRRPINGAILCLSISDLLTMTPANRQEHVAAIRARLQELYERCGVRVPVYVMFTKADLIAGFTEFFDDLGSEERRQVWGMTFPLQVQEADEPTQSFGIEFDGLVNRLNEMVLHRIHAERDPIRRGLIYDFPAQVQSIKQIAGDFLAEVFRGSRYEHTPFVRGVYFTSGTQEGTPIDRLVGALARNYGLNVGGMSALRGQGRSFFVSRLLDDIIFSEAELAGKNHKLERRRAVAQTALYAGIGIVTVGLIGLWYLSFLANQGGIERATQYVEQVEQQLEVMAGPVSLVDAVAPAIAGVTVTPAYFKFADMGDSSPMAMVDEPPGWGMRLGLYQGDKVEDATQISYRRLLLEQFLPRLMKTLETQITHPENPDYQYEALKRYLMLDSRDHYDAEAIKAWFRVTAPPATDPVANRAYLADLEALFAERPSPLPFALDEGLIDRARLDQLRVPLEDRVFGRLMRADVGAIEGFDIASAAGNKSSLVFVRKSGAPLSEPLPGMYTPEAYREVFLPESARIAGSLLEERWVLGQTRQTSPAEIASMAGTVKERYMRAYADAYEGLLLDLDVAPFGTPRQAATIIGALASEPSPIAELVDALAEATNLTVLEVPDLGEAGAEAAQELGAIIGNTRAGAGARRGVQRLDELQRRFDYLHRLKSGEEGDSPLRPIIDLIRQLYEFMSLVDSQGGRGGVPPHVAENGKQVMQRLQDEANTQGQLLRDLLNSASSRAQGLTSGGLTSFLNAEWSSGPGKVCQDTIAGRYPLYADAPREVQLEDFARFFAPDGSIDQFFQTYLADLVDTSRVPWRMRSTSVSISRETLEQFRRAAAIRDAFFRGGSTPTVSFDLTPDYMDANLESFAFSLDGNPRIVYSFGPKVPTTWRWPSGSGNSIARAEILPPGPDGARVASARGPWSLFRLLGPGGLEPLERPEHYKVSFSIDGANVDLVLMAHSAYNPFALPELNQFRCPSRL